MKTTNTKTIRKHGINEIRIDGFYRKQGELLLSAVHGRGFLCPQVCIAEDERGIYATVSSANPIVEVQQFRETVLAMWKERLQEAKRIEKLEERVEYFSERMAIAEQDSYRHDGRLHLPGSYYRAQKSRRMYQQQLERALAARKA